MEGNERWNPGVIIAGYMRPNAYEVLYRLGIGTQSVPLIASGEFGG